MTLLALETQSSLHLADFWKAPAGVGEFHLMRTRQRITSLSADKRDATVRSGEVFSFWQRLYFALGPIAGCMILDLADFLTFGPVGLVIGVPVGAAIGWWLGSLYAFKTQGRAVLAILSGIYCTIPFTELVPVATIVGGIARFYDPPKRV
jgi:hypothetical protein